MKLYDIACLAIPTSTPTATLTTFPGETPICFAVHVNLYPDLIPHVPCVVFTINKIGLERLGITMPNISNLKP